MEIGAVPIPKGEKPSAHYNKTMNIQHGIWQPNRQHSMYATKQNWDNMSTFRIS